MSIAEQPLLATSVADAVRPLAKRVTRPAIHVGAISARHRPMWDKYVDGHDNGTFFHGIAWMEAVRDAFGHRPVYLMARRNEAVTGVLPLFIVRSRFAGVMLVSVPYAVAGGILADDDESSVALWGAARDLADRVRATTIDLRSAVPAIPELPVRDQYVTFTRTLPTRSEEVLAWLPRKARAAARNAESKHGLTTEFGRHHLKAVWRLYCRSMRRLGSLSYPYSFFEGLVERRPHDSFVQVVRYGDRVIGGLVSFRHNDTFLPYFVGCDERHNRLQTNNFIYMTAMRKAVDIGCTLFDFGRTRVDNRGPFDFKRFCGFEPQTLGYQRWTADWADAPDLTPSNLKFQAGRAVWRRLPPAVCARLSIWVSRHIPG